MAIYSNQLLKSQIHRIVKAPSKQRHHSQLSIIIATRPENTSLIKAFKSPIIPPSGSSEEPITSLE
jgi:hypothetical protein